MFAWRPSVLGFGFIPANTTGALGGLDLAIANQSWRQRWE